jgi:hypothetical protein
VAERTIVDRADHADASASFLGAGSIRSQSCTVGRIHAGAARGADLLRGRHGVRAVLPEYPEASRTYRRRATPDWCVRAALVHAERSHEPGRGRSGTISLPHKSVGMHFGTFQLTREGIGDPLHALEQARDVRAIPLSRFSTLGFGESVRVG